MSDNRNEQNTPENCQIHLEQPQGAAGPAGANNAAQSQTSERKKQANRENAKHSTGPKTPSGKDVIRYNALKYGFYATDVVIRQGAAQESQEEFDILLDGLQRAWEPADVMQQCLVRTIAEAEWRLRRARRAEVGQIRHQTDSYYARLVIGPMEDSGLDGSIFSRPECKQSARNIMHDTRDKLALLTVVRKEVEECGYVSESTQLLLDRKFGREDLLAAQCYRISHLVHYQDLDAERSSGEVVERPVDSCQTSDAAGTDDYKKMLLGFIDVRATLLRDFPEKVANAEVREYEATLLTHHLPSKEFIDKLIRYETALERQKDKAISTLLKVQAKRR